MIDGCTLCKPEKIVYIDELDTEDSANRRLEKSYPYRKGNLIRPEVEWAGDGTVLMQLMIPESEPYAREAGLEMARKMGLQDPQVINLMVLHPAEGCFLEVKGKVDFDIDRNSLKIPPKVELLPEDELREAVKQYGLTVVAATVGEDDTALAFGKFWISSTAVLKSTASSITTWVPPCRGQADRRRHRNRRARHPDFNHHQPQRHSPRPDEETGRTVRGKGHSRKIILIAGGTQVTPDMAAETGLDATFGRGTKGIDVVDAMVKVLRKRG